MEYGTIYVKRLGDASINNYYITSDWKSANKIPYTKYQIKETDFRVKTATFTSPIFYDLTSGQFAILISSKYHENFGGILLDVEYDEDTGLYTYQCQDWSRRYIQKSEHIYNNCKLINVLKNLISHGAVSASKPTKKQLTANKGILSGLRALGKYDQSLYKGNIYKGNPFNQSISAIVRGQSTIEAIRSFVYSSLGYFDVYFNSKGVLQIKPISKSDWENTGLVLSDGGYYNRKFKFSTTNAITSVNVQGSELKIGKDVSLNDIKGLNLSAFFGNVGTTTSNPNKNTSNAVSSSKKKTTTTTVSNKYNNPFNNKKKTAWINADSGSGGAKSNIAKALRKDGWYVRESGTGPSYHYSDYFNVSKDYSVYITVYNGFCAGTIREAYSSKIQNVLKKKGVQLVVIFDTHDWTNPKGMKPYRYGDFSKYSAKRAWDDNFSSSDPSIKNVGDFFKKNKATYCAGPTTSDIMKQFKAGGYFKSKEKK